MSEQTAIATLSAAIANVREQCTGPECKDLLTACDAVTKAIGEYKPDGAAEPKSLPEAAAKARQTFAAAKSAAAASSDTTK